MKLEMLERWYNRREGKSVWDVYYKPSENKVRIENHIRDYLSKNNGYDYHIISHNSQIFTIGYIIGDVYYIQTRDNRYSFIPTNK